MTLEVARRSKEFIEQNAETLLREYCETSGKLVEPPVPVEEITRYHLALDLGFANLHEVLGADARRHQGDVLGAIFMKQERILIDRHLDPTWYPSMLGRYRFSVGHEVGHWRLHRQAMFEYSAQRPIDDRNADVVCRTTASTELVERQANYFSACLLIPRLLTLDVWRKRFGGLQPLIFDQFRRTVSINSPRRTGFRKLGDVLIDRGYEEFADGWAHYFASEFFGVSTQAMRIRLEDLGLLLRSRPVDLAS